MTAPRYRDAGRMQFVGFAFRDKSHSEMVRQALWLARHARKGDYGSADPAADLGARRMDSRKFRAGCRLFYFAQILGKRAYRRQYRALRVNAPKSHPKPSAWFYDGPIMTDMQEDQYIEDLPAIMADVDADREQEARELAAGERQPYSEYEL